MKTWIAIPLAIALITGCQQTVDSNVQSDAFPTGEIVGGRNVQESSQFSKQVALLTLVSETGMGLRCTGTFIAPNVVLTAGHCVTTYKITSGIISFGADSLNPTFATRVKRIVFDPNYAAFEEGDHGLDLALILTTDSLPANDVVTTLATKMPVGQTVFGAVGFGLSFYPTLEPAKIQDSGTLRYIKLLSAAQPLPTEQNQFIVSISPTFGVSHGDSGGPLFIVENGEVKQIGVASAEDAELGGHRAFYTSVIQSADWIQAGLKRLSN